MQVEEAQLARWILSVLQKKHYADPMMCNQVICSLQQGQIRLPQCPGLELSSSRARCLHQVINKLVVVYSKTLDTVYIE